MSEELSSELFERSECPVCGEYRSEPVIEKNGPHPSEWRKCSMCDLLYETPARLGRADALFRADGGKLPLYAVIDPAHVKTAHRASVEDFGADTKPWRDLYDYIETRLAPYSPVRRMLVEIGCGAGEVLDYICGPRYAADRVAGTEICRDCVLFNRARGREVYYCDISVSVPDTWRGQATLVIANEVMEHVREPHEFMRGVHALLAPDGLAWIKFARPNDLPYLEAGEWHYWSVPAIVMLLEDAGFAILSISRGGTYYDAVVRHDDTSEAHKARLRGY